MDITFWIVGHQLAVPLESEELDELFRRADQQGVNVTDLVHFWITERLAAKPE